MPVDRGRGKKLRQAVRWLYFGKRCDGCRENPFVRVCQHPDQEGRYVRIGELEIEGNPCQMQPSRRVLHLLELFRYAYKQGFNGMEPIYTYSELMAMPAWKSKGLRMIADELAVYLQETKPTKPKDKQDD